MMQDEMYGDSYSDEEDDDMMAQEYQEMAKPRTMFQPDAHSSVEGEEYDEFGDYDDEDDHNQF